MGTIADILREKGNHVITIEPDAAVCDAAARMNEHEIGSLVVVKNGYIKGIFSERDVLRRVVAPCRHPEDTVVKDVMTRHVVCCRPHMPLDELARLLKAHNIRHVPILNEEGRLVGLVSSTDLARHRVQSQDMALHYFEEYIYGRAS